MARRRQGSETWHRLLEWDRSQAAAERLAGHVLRQEGFEAINPSHPLGGPDGLKDVVCHRAGLKWVAAAYFPRREQRFAAVTRKFVSDLEGVTRNDADGFLFLTNQELGLKNRAALSQLLPGRDVEIYHLERIASLLDSPSLYGVRLDFLDIEITKEEQIAFIAARDEMLQTVVTRVDQLADFMTELASGNEEALASLKAGVPVQELREFKDLLAALSGSSFGSSISPNIHSLRVPLQELRAFVSLVNPLSVGYQLHHLHVLLDDLKRFKSMVEELVGGDFTVGKIARVHVPLDELREYEQNLDRILQKQRLLQKGV